jgi:hypothetical protein
MKAIERGFGLAALVVGLLAGACARSPEASAPPASSPAQAPGAAMAEAAPEPTTLAEAEALLEQAKADLDRLALNEVPPSSAGAAAPAAAPPAPVTAPSPAPERKSSADDKPRDDAASSQGRTCDTACKAFSSLTRASDAVCRLDTEGGRRCERARQIRDDAAQRVATCGCAK